MAKSKTMQKRVSKNYNITQDALKVIEAFKKLTPENERKVSEFVDEAILHYGAVVLGDKMPKLSEDAPSHIEKSLDDIHHELNRLRKKFLRQEYSDKSSRAPLLEALAEAEITSENELLKAWKKRSTRAFLKETGLKNKNDWCSFIDWQKDKLGEE